MRIISMQGSIVWDILKQNNVYYADIKLVREANDYSVDINRLDGRVPIWCYHWTDLSFYTMYNGEVLDNVRMEMSLEKPNCWDGFIMLELEVPDNIPKLGYTHNASTWVRVIPEIRIDWVKAVYSIRDANVKNPYWKVITPIWINGNDTWDVITLTELDCEKVTEQAEESKVFLNKGSLGKCLHCGETVPYMLEGKHFCSLACMWEHRRKFTRTALKAGFTKEVTRQLYASSTDLDFEHGMLKLVRRLTSQ